MTHAYIDEHDIASRYALNKLSLEEQAAFEAHLIGCAQCLDSVELARAFRDGLRSVAAADAAFGPGRPVQPAVGERWSLQPWLAAAAVLIAAASGVAAVVSMRQLARATAAVADLERRSDETGRTAGALQDRLAAAERELRQRLATPSIDASVPVFSLTIVRGGEGGPPTQVSLPASAPVVVMSVELPGAAGFEEYRAVLTNAAGQPVWRADKLRPSSPDALGIGLSTRLMPPGDYVLTLEGVGRQGRSVPLSHYRFRVTSPGH
jgi:hypothetical protein